MDNDDNDFDNDNNDVDDGHHYFKGKRKKFKINLIN